MFYFIITLSIIALYIMYYTKSNKKNTTINETHKIKHDMNDWTFSMNVPFSRDEIINVLTDFTSYSNYVNEIIESTVYEQKNEIIKVRFVTRVLFIHLTSHIEHTIKYNGMTWRLDPNFNDNIFKDNHGMWNITEISASECCIYYKVVLCMKLPFPKNVIEIIKKQACLIATNWIIIALEKNKYPYHSQFTEPWYMRIPCFSCLVQKYKN